MRPRGELGVGRRLSIAAFQRCQALPARLGVAQRRWQRGNVVLGPFPATTDMKVFVAGATGFIAGATCRALVAAGHEVTGLARTPEEARTLESDRVRAIVGTLDDPDTYLRAAGRPEAVIHLAATWIRGQETIEKAQSVGTRMLEWTRA